MLLLRALAALLLVVLLGGCGGNGQTGGGTAAEPSASVPTDDIASLAKKAQEQAEKDRVDQPRVKQPKPVVVLISVDALSSAAVRQLGPEGAPALWRIIDEGAATLEARPLYEDTRTLPNHSSMLTGIPRDGGTGVDFNEDNGGTLESQAGRYVSGVFDVAHDHGLRTALLAEKDKFNFLIRSWDAAHGGPDRVGRNDGRDKVDDAVVAPVDRLEDTAEADLAAGTRLVFWHLAAPDVAGHAHGFLGPVYLDAVQAADAQVGQLLDLVDEQPKLRRRLTIVLTADHGGTAGTRDHSDVTAPGNYRIPFAVWGRGVRQGADLYELNPKREDPGTGRPGYDGPQPIRNLDAARLVLQLLGLGDPVMKVR